MKLVPPELTETELEKNGFKNNIFQRTEFGNAFRDIVLSPGNAITIGLTSEWGNGKTTFIKMWQGHTKDEIQSIYFDAFANDYQKEPFLALTAEIYKLIAKDDKDKYKKKVEAVLKSTIRGGLKVGIRFLSGGIVSEGAVDHAVKNMSELLSARSSELISDRFENVVEDKKAMADFRECLQECAKKQDKHIVFIIDELDRCRPDFALELIEQIKHLFSVEGITFLLVANKTQLEASIKYRYGDINASKYLQKFVHLWVQLPREASKYDDGEKYMRHVLEGMFGIYRTNIEVAEKTLSEMVQLLQPSFREIEQILIYFPILNNIIAKGIIPIYQYLLAFVCYLKVCKPDLLEKIIADNINAGEICDNLKIDDSMKLKNLIIFDMANQEEKNKLTQENGIYMHISQELRSFSTSNEIRSSIIKRCYNWIEILDIS